MENQESLGQTIEKTNGGKLVPSKSSTGLKGSYSFRLKCGQPLAITRVKTKFAEDYEDFQQDKENVGFYDHPKSNNSQKHVHMARDSKKIQKYDKSIMMKSHTFLSRSEGVPALNDVTNKVTAETSEKISKEDLGKKATPATLNYSSLLYSNQNKAFQFYCFDDKDLKVPETFMDKTIMQICDNDCETDDEQVNGAIHKLYLALESSLKEMKNPQPQPSQFDYPPRRPSFFPQRILA